METQKIIDALAVVLEREFKKQEGKMEVDIAALAGATAHGFAEVHERFDALEIRFGRVERIILDHEERLEDLEDDEDA